MTFCEYRILDHDDDNVNVLIEYSHVLFYHELSHLHLHKFVCLFFLTRNDKKSSLLDG